METQVQFPLVSLWWPPTPALKPDRGHSRSRVLKHVSYPSLMAMGICRQGSLSGGQLGREIPSAVRGTVQLPFF
ncbi:hypothetical protein Hanom_Chr11g01057381 [Helianthus anomalus]